MNLTNAMKHGITVVVSTVVGFTTGYFTAMKIHKPADEKTEKTKTKK